MPRVLTLSLLLILTSCTGFKASGRTYTSKSPDGRAELRIEESNCSFSNCAIRATLTSGPRSISLWERGDGTLKFAHVAWSQDRVAVFIDGGYSSAIKSAFDFSNWSFIRFAEAEPWFRQSLIQSYDVTQEELAANNGDVLKWAMYPRDGKLRRSVQEFLKRLSNTKPAN